MNNFNYNNLTPFKWFVLENFPFIENDFEAINNYQLFSKVVEYLNNTIDNVNVLGNLVEQFSNYFDNLDVQEEINNKLDEMATDGTLMNLIQPYINTVFTPAINSMQSQINSLASGSPLVASSVSEMTDTTKIYVNTTNGHWYTYNGTNWIDGGVYQAEVIDDNAISFINLDELLQANFNIDYTEPLELTTEQTGYCTVNNNNMVIQPDVNYNYQSLELELNETYLFNFYNNYASNGLIIADENNHIIYASNPSNNLTNISNKIIKINQNGLIAYISYLISNNTNTNTRNYVRTARKITNISNNLKLSNNIANFATVENTYNQSNTYTNFVNNNDGTMYIYSIEKGKTYKLQAYNVYGVVGYSIHNENLGLVKTSSTGFVSNPTLVHEEYQSTFDGFVVMSDYQNYTHSIQVIQPAIEIDDDKLNKNVLYNKKVLFFGDSITAGTGSWADITTIRNENNMTGDNFAVGGMTFTVKQNSDASNNILLRIKQKIALDNNVDYIILQGGVNDAFQSLPKGTPLANDDFTTQCDTSTFSGAFEDAIRYILTEVPECKVGFIINAKIPRLPILIQYMEIAKSICEKYSVPTLDFYNESGLCAGIQTINNEYFLHTISQESGDGTHPTSTGYAKYLNNKVESFMKAL